MSGVARARCFLAVPPDPGWVESARALTGRLRPESPPAAWTRPESWHLTLRFLGDVSRGAISRFLEAVGAAARLVSGARLAASGSRIFPPRGPARVLAVGFREDAPSAPLAELARRAEAAAQSAGLPAERRTFHAHVTFARLRRPWPEEAILRFRREADAWAFPAWPVRSCVLYESRLDPAGARHTPIAEIPLLGPEPGSP